MSSAPKRSGFTFRRKANDPQGGGFTLVELLVVISIIAILSVIGVTVYTGIQKSARDAKKKADVESIMKAYEVRYNSTGSYGGTTLIEGTAFASGSIPTPPEGGEYDVILDNDTGGIKACSTLEGSTEFCKGSIQEQPPADDSDVTCLLGCSDGGGSSTPTPTPTPPAAPVCPASGLLGYWSFNDGSGSTVTDDSGNGKNGTWGGSGTHWTTGKFGGAGTFNGSNDLVNLGSFNTASNIKTIAFWAKFNSLTDGQEIISKSSGCSGIEVLLYGGGLSMYVMNTGCNPYGAASIPYNQLDTSSYHFITATQDGSQMKLYLNGALKTTASSPSTIANPQNLMFGSWNSGGRMFNGNLDEVRIYNHAISASEVTTLYGAGQGCAP